MVGIVEEGALGSEEVEFVPVRKGFQFRAEGCPCGAMTLRMVAVVPAGLAVCAECEHVSMLLRQDGTIEVESKGLRH